MMDDLKGARELDIRDEEELISALNLADSTVYKTWITGLNRMEILECPQDLVEAELNDMVRIFKVKRFVYEKNENSRDKLVSVFHATASCGGSVIILINSDGEQINYYFGTKVPLDSNTDRLVAAAEVMQKSLAGNFPGTRIAAVPGGNAIDKLSRSVFTNKEHEGQQKQICTVTGVAGLRSKEESHEKLFVQSMEKLIDTMRGEQYSLLLIADPVSPEQIQTIKRGYENLYSQLVPFAGSELNYGQNESASISNSITKGLSKSINKSVTDTLTYTKGTSDSHTKGKTKTDGMNFSAGALGAGIGAGIGSSILPGVGTAFGAYIGSQLGNSFSFNTSTAQNEGRTTGSNKSHSKSKADTTGTTDTTSTQEGNTDTKGEGSSRGIQLKFENKAVKNLLEKIDLQLKRLDASADTGMWNCSAYCLADTVSTAKIAASSYQSLLRGENSSVETGAITEWTGDSAKKILPWLEKFHHPRLRLTGTEITPSSFISGAELTIHAGLPRTSVGGLPVVEMAPFGREVSIFSDTLREGVYIPEYGDRITLGQIYHMGNEEKLPVILSKRSLTAHTFITGSTGSGKSNTIYQLLREIQDNNAHFLVVEPAKGEYKNVFGTDPSVKVYGTNPEKNPLLRLNPFRFPKGIHVLEHLDRLIEIFNVCWPMYAAMPAVLKDAIERSYEEAGWDLRRSTNRFKPALYPSFTSVQVNVGKIMDSSEYSEENKGNYKGALITRLRSLANGINGMIFVDEELTGAELFDQNVIVDLSRLGSMETKALIMGLLVMKLQEYRMTCASGMNVDLSHITVLEEAHNLLKRTSTEQSSDSANLLGKSVEMLANAIAEMRTYGEGFIIADQSPGLLDMSVIRNTNTKIILRLPDEGDRVLVGKAAGLRDDQIGELARLQCGVAAVYQNDWIQGVLCKVNHYKIPDAPYSYDNTHAYTVADSDLDALKKRILNYLVSNTVKEPGEEVERDMDRFYEAVLNSNLETRVKVRVCDFIRSHRPPATLEPVYEVIAGMYHYPRRMVESIIPGYQITQEWAKAFRDAMSPSIDSFDWELQKIVMQCAVLDIASHNPKLKDLPEQLPKII
ncbi:MAG: DUF87 domain-containing protein [Treponema sp.]|nr:DUF87 domain-containing protein [Treponema sp.]